MAMLLLFSDQRNVHIYETSAEGQAKWWRMVNNICIETNMGKM